MALCSQAFNNSTKRSCHFSNSHNNHNNNKRLCFGVGDGSTGNGSTFPILTRKKSVCIYSSSDEENDSTDEQGSYNADQIRAKRRASSRISFSMNSELSRAMSKYSDDESDDEVDNHSNYNTSISHSRSNSSTTNVSAAAVAAAVAASHSRRNSNNLHDFSNVDSDEEDNVFDNLDCKLSSSPVSSHLNLNITNNNHKGGFIQISDSSKNSTFKSVPDTDKNARSRCFDYLVGAIDEAWARYCDATTHVEDEAYGYVTPNSVATDDEDYLDNTTDFTDYEDSDFEFSNHHKQAQEAQKLQQSQQQMRPSMKPSMSNCSISSKQDPASSQLQALKDRLTKAKYYLQDLVDSEDSSEVNSFWKRWDMVKYATIELVEDDDDDEVVETTIEELENGRLFVN
ncbi:uncharacterized protein RJT21DRAFT_25507 [Scheffersomyces amazonensis]|uniref:uncharacterized protein n=1 Tax=Scheffersomyces amazonensis TaxID=1078765 RepID=UPI00315DB41C